MLTGSERTEKDKGDGAAEVAAFRAALRLAELAHPDDARARAAFEHASRPLIKRCLLPLTSYCDELAGGTFPVPGRARIDGADLTQEAWARVLRYLKGPRGERVSDISHMIRLLRCTARNCLLDHLDSAPVAAEANAVALDAPESRAGISSVTGDGGERSGERSGERRIAAPAHVPDILRFAGREGNGAYCRLVEALFNDEESFRRSARLAGIRRHPRQFRGYILYELGLYYWRESDGAPPFARAETTTLLRAFVSVSGVPEEWWNAVEISADSSTLEIEASQALIDRINAIFGIRLQAGNVLSVLRHDLNRCVKALVSKGDGETQL